MTAASVCRWDCGGYLISTDPDHFDLDAFCGFMADAYWARDRSRAVNAAAAANSVVFGLYDPVGAMVGSARAVTDYSTFGWVCDVYVAEEHRGRGLGKALVAAVCEHPDLAGVRRLVLVTLDAHGLYEARGFSQLHAPERWMELRRPPPSEAPPT